MSNRKLLVVELPTGVANIEYESDMGGERLIIDLKNGRTIALDCGTLDGEHECQLGLYDAWHSGDDVGLVAGMAFNGVGTKVRLD